MMRSLTKAAATVVAFLVLGLISPVMAAPTFPALSGRVVDRADLLSPDAERDLTTKLADLERRTGDQVVVVTLADLQGYPIEDYGYRLGRAWGLGDRTRDDGLLLIVAPSERKVRIEVGYGLEPVMTDALSSLIIQTEILPRFRRSQYREGIEAGTDAILRQLSLDRGQAEARAQAAVVPRPAREPTAPFIVLIVLFFVLTGLARGFGVRGRRYRRGAGMAPIMVWTAAEALRSRGGWRDGGGGSGFGGSFGGGGFGGGGGSFGGGGASGGW